MNNEAEYRAALEIAHREFPPWKNMKYTPATCPCHDYSFVVFCDGSDWDICEAEAVMQVIIFGEVIYG